MIRTAESDRAATPLDDYGEAVDPLFSASSRPNNLTRPDAPPA